MAEDLRNSKDFFQSKYLSDIRTRKTHENIVRPAVFKRIDFKRTLTKKLKDLFVWSLYRKCNEVSHTFKE